MRSGVTLVVPTIPPRRKMLDRALGSVWAQRRPFSDVHVCVDVDRRGAGPTRTRGMMRVDTEWTAFLDDDDDLYPDHLDVLIHHAIDHDADLVFPWFDVVGGTDPFPEFEGQPFDTANPHMFPVTVLARTDVLQQTHGFPLACDSDGDDWPLWKELCAMGARIEHVNKRTWRWYHHGSNTSGRPDRW